MRYIRVIWKHQDPDDPVIIISEIDADQWEHRKVEIWADGRKGYADRISQAGGTRLGIEPWQDLDQLDADPEFEVHYITGEEFEQVWVKRLDL
jgi:hypothetical protein